MEVSAPTKLLEFSIDDLYGLYNHKIRFNHGENISILHGPNGVGKTALLRSVKSLFSADFDTLSKVPFRRINVFLDSGYRVLVVRLSISSSDLAARDIDPKAKIEVSIFHGEKTLAKHVFVSVSPRRVRDKYEYYLRNLAMKNADFPNELDNDFELLDRSQRYGADHIIPESVQARNKKRPGARFIRDFLNGFSVHFVETNRLYRHSPDVKGGNVNGASSQMVLTVQECAKDLVVRIGSAMKNYGAKSQLLDQSFPQRFISESLRSMGVDEIKEKLIHIGSKLKALRSIGILDVDSVQAFDIESLDFVDENKIEVMSLYVLDSESKLEVFDGLLSRIQLLLGSMDSKFRNKRVFLSKGRGFFVKLDSGDELPLDALSSGEQHELVLMYELLFKVPAGTLVLIDEPELSLHVSWQKAFLPELISIAKAAEFTAVVATHSPFIVGDRYDLMTALDAEQDDE